MSAFWTIAAMWTEREIIEQGFTRNLARRVGSELDVSGVTATLRERCSNLLHRVELEDAIEAAEASVALARKSTVLATVE